MTNATARRGRFVTQAVGELRLCGAGPAWARDHALSPARPPLRLAEYRGYVVVHSHAEGGPCNRRCRYQKTLRHAIASRISALKGRFL